jgi:tetratricopeptide (TPR) repeat protein
VSDARSSEVYADYLDPALREATRVCALPHWLDDNLGVELLELAGHNGTSHTMLAHVKRLPIVRPFEGTSWRVEERARERLVKDLSETPEYPRLSSLLAARFARDHDSAKDRSERGARVAQWRAAYHFAEIDPRQAVDRLSDVVTEAGNRERVADIEAAIELFDEKETLAPFQVEAAYARGRLAYVEQNYSAARSELGVVWAARAGTRETAVAGHLLGVIDTKEKTAGPDTQRILRAAAQVAGDVGDDLNRCQILNTLVNHLLDHREGVSMADIEKLAQEEVEVAADLGAVDMAAAHITLGQVQIQRGSKHFADARHCLQRAVELAERSGRPERLKVALLSSSWLARSEGRLPDAIELVDRALQIDIHAAADRNTRLTARRLSDLLAEVGAPLRDWLVVEQSAECLAYFHEARLVLVGHMAGAEHTVTVPNELRGAWEDCDRGVRVDLEGTVSLRPLLGRHAGVVLRRSGA